MAIKHIPDLTAAAALAGSDYIPLTQGTNVPVKSTLDAIADFCGNPVQSDVASAATCNIGAATTLKVRITGTTTITSFGSSINRLRFILFAASLTLTHNATSLILPGSADILTSAGDYAIAMSDASGNWRVINYQRTADTFLQNPLVVIFKSADESRNTTTTLADDATLVFPMAANLRYRFTARIWLDTVAAADFKYRHTGPASPASVRIVRQDIAPSATAWENIAVDEAYSSADVVILTAGTTGGYVEFKGVILNGSNAGNFAFKWAQNSSDAGNTTVRAGSYIEYQIIA